MSRLLRLLLAVLSLWLTAALATVAAASPQTGSDDLGGNLLTDGGFEAAAGALADASGPTGWQLVQGGFEVVRGSWSKVSASEGRGFLRSTAGSLAVIEQLVELAGKGPGRPRALSLHASFAGFGRDRAEIRLELLDSDGVAIAREQSSTLATAWTPVVLAMPVPDRATVARVSLIGHRVAGDFADALFDEVSLEDHGLGCPGGLVTMPQDRLLALAESERGAARRAAMRALAQDPRGQLALVELHKRLTAPLDREPILEALALAGSNQAEPLVRAMLQDEKAAGRLRAIDLVIAGRLAAADILEPLLLGNLPANVRGRAVDALLLEARSASVRLLARHVEEKQGASFVLGRLQRLDSDHEPFFKTLIAPALDPDSKDIVARNAAMGVLGARKDPRFFAHFEVLAKKGATTDVLAQWFRWAASMQAEKAAGIVLELVKRKVTGADRALLAAASALSSRAILDWARTDGITAAEPMLRRAACRLLGTKAGNRELEILRKATEDSDAVVAIEAVDVLSTQQAPRVEALLEQLYSRAPGPVAAAALRALGTRMKDRKALAARALGAISGHPRFEVRIAALDLLVAEEVVGGRPVVTSAMKDSTWQVRAAAYRALTRDRSRASLDLLFAQLAEERGPALTFLCDALGTLTGMKFGDDPAAWSRWWNVVAKDFAPPDGATPAKKGGERPATSTEYWGIPIRGQKLAFVVDLSGSMNAMLDGKTRLEVAKERLIEVLRALDPAHEFAVIGFGTDIHPFEKELVPADKKNVERAAQWIERLTIRGATNIYDSLEFALAIPRVETVFLLTDGGPSAGKLIDMDEIRRAIRLQNADRLVRINTIQIGGGPREKNFLGGLASENHGESRDR
ncbi:MAG: VWA domain-containing protein [Planctomycetota bacterium]